MQINLDPRLAAQSAYYGLRLTIVYLAIFGLMLFNLTSLLTLNLFALCIQLWLTDMAFTHAARLERDLAATRSEIDIPFIQPIRSLFRGVNWRDRAPRVTITVERPTKSANGASKSTKSRRAAEYTAAVGG
jgi:hypothetical protein